MGRGHPGRDLRSLRAVVPPRHHRRDRSPVAHPALARSTPSRSSRRATLGNNSNKVIISCAVTGSIHTPTMSDALPITPDEIAAQAIEAAEAGAAILHLHARDPKDGRPTPDPAVYMRFLPRIKHATDAVVNITTGESVHIRLEERLAAPLLAKPEMCSLNMGTMNFGIFPLADRYTSWKHDWEQRYLRGSDDFIFRNTFRDIERILKTLGEEHGTRFEHECYD